MSKEKPTEIRRTPHLKGPVLALITKDTILLQAEPEDAPRGCLDLIRHHNSMLALAVKDRLARTEPTHFELPNAMDPEDQDEKYPAVWTFDGKLLFDRLTLGPWDRFGEGVYGAALLGGGGVAVWDYYVKDGVNQGRVILDRFAVDELTDEHAQRCDMDPRPWSIVLRLLGREIV